MTSWLSINLSLATLSPAHGHPRGRRAHTVVDQLLVPGGERLYESVTGATALMSGATVSEASAVGVVGGQGRRGPEAAPNARPAEVLLPGETVSRLVPQST